MLPRICDVLAPQLGGSNSLVFRCASDRPNYFQAEGSSYEWNYLFNHQVMEQLQLGTPPASQTIPPHEAPLLYDYELVHPGGTGGRRNIHYADGHVAVFP